MPILGEKRMRCRFCKEETRGIRREGHWWRICDECNNEFVWGVDSEVGKSIEDEMPKWLLREIGWRWK